MRSYRIMKDMVAVSAGTQETAINTVQAVDTSLYVAQNTVLNIEPRREDNKEELTGKEEPTMAYNLGQTASVPFAFDKMQPGHAGFIFAYALGTISTVAAGATGYLHTITPIDGDVDERRSNPSFPTQFRYDEIFKAKFFSCFVDSFTLTLAADAWAKLSANIKATGKVTTNIEHETIAALDNVTELTLDTNGVQGATAAARLKSIHRVMAETSTGVWEELTCSAASSASPAVLTIESAGGAGTETINYKVLYVPTETGWTFPAYVAETPMRVSEAALNIGGAWSGTVFAGGRTMTCEVKNVEWGFNNNMQLEFCFGEQGLYAGRAFRDGRTQTLKVDRELRDYIMQQDMTDDRQFGLHFKIEGAEYETGHKYTVEVIFPLLQIKTANIGADGKRLSESLEISVLEHATYGSVITKVKNKVATYAA